MPVPSLADLAPWNPPDPGGAAWPYVAAGVGALAGLVVLWRLVRGRSKVYPDLEQGLREDLAGYPPPPPGAARLTVNGLPARLRLVVVAPTGKLSDPITADDVPGLLDQVYRGLGPVAAADKPRMKVWPPQLSVAGFAPTFHRVVRATDPHWVKLAGPARTGRRPILLGLVVWTDERSGLGDVVVDSTEWGELLGVGQAPPP